jgi:magnesium chelatase subunit D
MSAADDAALCASLLALGCVDLGGACLRSLVQPARTQWLESLRELLPAALPIRRIPCNIPDSRLLGGLDLTATLRANRPIAERGALASADGGVVVIAMAERLSPHTAACLNAVLDCGEIRMQREGVEIHDPARVAVVALDESMSDDEGVPASLLDRLAFLIDLNGFDLRTPLVSQHDPDDIVTARALLPDVNISADLVAALCGTGMALGAGSARVSVLAVRVARMVAALAGRTEVGTEDAEAAGRLVFAPRATQIPQTQPPEPAADASPQSQAETPPPVPPTPPPPPSADSPPGTEPAPEPPKAADESPATDPSDPAERDKGDLEDLVLAAVQAAIPPGLLARLRSDAIGRAGAAAAGRAGALRKGGSRGRPAGVLAGVPRGQARLNVLETLRCAAPWQKIRGRHSPNDGRVRVEPADFRVTRYQQRAQTLTIFAIDASGSSALNRLAEAKGAVELLLADCYVRRDQVAVIVFRGRQAEVLLPPTRSLVRAKRNLAGVPGGGGTPIASAIDSALAMALQAQRRGETPMLVLLSDGRANVARNGAGGRDAAQADALQSARRFGQANIRTLFIDTSPRPNDNAAKLASAMRADYIPLPFADSRELSRVVNAATGRP